MSGIANWQAQITIDIEDLKKRIKVAEGELDNITKKDHKIKLDLDTKILESAVQKLDKMLDSLGKGTGDFKQFENLSKELSSVTTDINNISKAFSSMNDGSDFANNIKSINTSLSALSQHFVSEMSGKMASSIKEVKHTLSDVGDGSELAPLLKTIANIESAIDKLSSSIKGIGFNMNIDVGSDAELEAKIQSKMSNALQAYQRLFEHIKMSGVGGSIVNTNFFEFDINQFDTMMAKIQAYRKFIENMRNQVKSEFGGKDLLYTETDKKYWTSAAAAIGQLTKAQNEMNKSADTNPLDELFGKTDLTGIIEQLNLIVSKLDEISVAATKFSETFSQGLSVTTSVEEVSKLTEKVKEFETELEKVKSVSTGSTETNISPGMKDAFPDKDVSASVESATNSIKEENNVLEQNTQKVKKNIQAKEQNANIDFSKYDKRLDSYNGKIDKYKTTIDRFNDGGWTSDAYLKNVQVVKNAVDEYETLLKELKGKDASLVTSEDISKLDNYEKKIKDTIATVTNMSAAEKGYNFVSGQKELDKIHKLLAENSKMSSEAKSKIKAYYAEIESGNPSMSLDKIHGEILKIYNAEVEAGRAGKTLWDTLKNSGFHQIAAQMAGMVGVYDVINLGKEGFNVVRELNTALTEMRKVSDETVQSLKDYQATTFDTADAVGTTAKQIQNSTADWMRLGESMNQAAESAKDANVLLNVSEFEGIDEATESLVSMSQAYKDLDKMDIIDVLNNIGNNYSISTDGLATALKDSASALVTANNDLNEAVSLTTAGNAITQDPSKVGAGLRTISLRLVGTEEAKQELSDLGEETDGMITTVSKLRDTIMDATKAASSDGKGFDILDSNGNYKSTYEIMQGLADLYDNIVKKDKELGTNNLNLLLETIAGKNRSNIAASILQNGDMLRSVYEDAQKSEGSAEKELNSYLDSIDGKMAQLENRAQEFWFKVIDSETIKNGIDLLSTLLKGATDFVDTVGLLPTILTGIGAALSFKNVGRDKMYSLSF